MIEVDARGFSCPIPVVKTKKALDQNPGKAIIVTVESEVSRENVLRLAKSRGYAIEMEKVADEYRLTLTPSGK